MRFEITHENGQKEIKEFRGEKAVVGSGDNVDILIPGEHVAKNQVIIEKIEGKIYVTDLDNENGTYINDELIEPHKRIEFLSFFPVQIGPKVFIHLLPEEEHKPEAPSTQATKPVTDFEFTSPPVKKIAPKKTATPDNINNIKKNSGKAAAKPQGKNAQSQLALIVIAISLLLAGVTYHMSKDDLTPEVIATIKDPHVALQEEQQQQFSTFYEKNLPVEKCRNEVEQIFCNMLNFTLQKSEGFLIENGVLYLYLNLDRALTGPMRDFYNKIPGSEQFLYFLVSTIFNYQFLIQLEENKISHINFVLFNVIEGAVTLTKYFSNSVDLLLKNVAIDDVRTSLTEARSQDTVHLVELIQPHIDWVNFKK